VEGVGDSSHLAAARIRVLAERVTKLRAGGLAVRRQKSN